MTWTQYSATRSTCSSRRAWQVLHSWGYVLHCLLSAWRGLSPSLLLVTAEWDRRSRPSLTWAIVGGRGPQGPCSCPGLGRRPASLNPSHWPHCCCLLSVGTLCPLCSLSLCTGRREVLPCLSQLTFCPSPPWLLARSSQPFLFPGLQNLVCEPALWGVPGCHH